MLTRNDRMSWPVYPFRGNSGTATPPRVETLWRIEMIAPYQGPWPCPTCGQEFDAVTLRPDLDKLLAEARAKVEAMTPEERAEMHEAQRRSWVRGELGLGLENAAREKLGKSYDTYPQEVLVYMSGEIARLKAELDRLGDEREEARQRWQETLGRCLDARARIEDELAEAAAQREKDAAAIQRILEVGEAVAAIYRLYLMGPAADKNAWFAVPFVLGKALQEVLARAKEAGYE